MENKHYVYIYLDDRKPGFWRYKDFIFLFQPFYVGVGKNNRINSHLKKSKTDRNYLKKSIISKIQKEFSRDPMRFKLYENWGEDDAYIEEINIIKYFGRVCNKTGILSNITPGGKSSTTPSVKVIQMDTNGIFIKLWHSIKSTEDSGFCSGAVSKCCLGDYKHHKGFKWKYENPESMPKVRNIAQKPECPRCHGRKSDARSISCRKCDSLMKKESGCMHKIKWPTPEEMSKMVLEKRVNHIAKELGVDFKTIGRHCKSRGIEIPPKSYWNDKVRSKSICPKCGGYKKHTSTSCRVCSRNKLKL